MNWSSGCSEAPCSWVLGLSVLLDNGCDYESSDLLIGRVSSFWQNSRYEGKFRRAMSFIWRLPILGFPVNWMASQPVTSWLDCANWPEACIPSTFHSRYLYEYDLLDLVCGRPENYTNMDWAPAINLQMTPTNFIWCAHFIILVWYF